MEKQFPTYKLSNSRSKDGQQADLINDFIITEDSYSATVIRELFAVGSKEGDSCSNEEEKMKDEEEGNLWDNDEECLSEENQEEDILKLMEPEDEENYFE